MCSQTVIDLHDPVACCFVTNAPHRTTLTVLRPVPADQLHKARRGYSLPVTDMLHSLTYRTHQVVIRFVIMQIVVTELLDTFVLFLIERIVFDVSVNPFLL